MARNAWTPQRIEVCRLFAQGYRSPEIALLLKCQRVTVDSIFSQLADDLGIKRDPDKDRKLRVLARYLAKFGTGPEQVVCVCPHTHGPPPAPAA